MSLDAESQNNFIRAWAADFADLNDELEGNKPK